MKKVYALLKHPYLQLEEIDGEFTKVKFEGDAVYVGDYFHSMDELYDHRMALNIALFNYIYMLEQAGTGINKVIKSRFHHDGSMFDGGYFIVMAITTQGQISYHYKLENWTKFNIPEVERAPEYDGHSSDDVIERLLKL